MPKLTIITGAHKTGKTTRAKEVIKNRAYGQANILADEVEDRLPGIAHILNTNGTAVLVLNVPEGTEVVHEHLVPRQKEEREYRIVGFPGCDAFHPQNEREAVAIVRREAATMNRVADDYRSKGDHSMAAEMDRRVRGANYESRVITEWEEGK